MESEQVALILQLVILAMVLYLLVTHGKKSNEEMAHLPVEAEYTPDNMNDMDFSRRYQ